MSAHVAGSPLVAALGWTLLHFVWQGALLGCATAVLLTALRRARPETRYAVACAGLLACLVWPAFDLVRMLGDADAPAALARDLDGLAGAALQADGAGLPGWLQAHLDRIVALWAACALALGLRMALGLVWIGRAAGGHAVDAQWQRRLSDMAHRCGIARTVALRVVDGLASPVTAGWWRPVVLVPASLITGMAPPLLEALLAHELGHVRRHDYLVNLAQNVVETLLFYHPAVWWISSRIRLEREQIADDFAARHLGDARRLALALSELERMQFAAQRLAPAANGGDLVARIRRLLRADAQALNWKAALPVLGLAIACAAQAHIAASPTTPTTPAATAGASQAGLTRKALVDFNTCARPHYPRADLDAGHEGTVTLAFLVDRLGAARQAKVASSSGYPGMDEAARSAIERCGFHPALAHGRPVQQWVKVQYVWILQ